MILGVIQQMSGAQAVIQYAQIIFDQANSNLDGKYLTMILGTVQLICTIICMFTTDRSGRKSLLMISCIGVTLSTAMVATYFTLQYNQINTDALVWLPITGVITFMISYSVGLAPVLFTLLSELFPTNVKALGTTINVVLISFLSAGVTLLFLIIADVIGIHVPFWIFTGFNLVSPLFVYFYIPETKGKTLEEIQKKLHNLLKHSENRKCDIYTL